MTAEASTIPETRCDTAFSTQTVAVATGTEHIDLATGWDGAARIAATEPDDDWDVVTATSEADAYSVTPHSAWIDTAPDAGWINAKKTYESSGTGGIVTGTAVVGRTIGGAVDGGVATAGPLPEVGPTKTTFRRVFELPRQSFLERLDLEYAADNGVTFFLNGVAIGGFDPTVEDSSAFTQRRPLVYAGPLLHDGANVLDAVVTDYGVATGLLVRGGYDGCFVRWTELGTCVDVRGDRLTPYPGTPVDLRTGTNALGQRNNVGDTDAKWTTVLPAPGPAYSVATYNGWYTGSTVSRWINSSPSALTRGGVYPGDLGELDDVIRVGGSSSAAAGPVPVNGPTQRRFKTTFSTGAGTRVAELNLRWAADNDVVFFLDGNPVGTFTGATANHFNQLNRLYWSGTLTGGTHSVEALVTDYGTATGLLVEGGATICNGINT
jgi:hypothetical protein